MTNWLLTGQRWILFYIFAFGCGISIAVLTRSANAPIDLKAITLAITALVFVVNVAPIFVFSFFGYIQGKTKPPLKNTLPVTLNKFKILIPAFNEAHVLANSLRSLQAQSYPATHFETVVVFNGTDASTEVVARYRADLFVCSKPGIGKTPAILEYVNQAALDTKAYIVILDADNVLDQDFLLEINNTIEAHSAIAVQGCHCVLKSSSNWVSCGLEAAYCASTFLYNVGRARLLNSPLLCGTGFALRGDVFLDVFSKVKTQTEDIEINGLLSLIYGAGVYLASNAIFYDEKPDSIRIAIRQRVRWMVGHIHVMWHYSLKLTAQSFALRQLRPLELALYYCYPIGLLASSVWILFCAPILILGSSEFYALPSLVVWIFAITTFLFIVGLPWLGYIAAPQTKRSGRMLDGLRYSLQAALFASLAWPIAIILAIFSILRTDWMFHTPHKALGNLKND